MRRFAAIILAVVIFTLAACGGNVSNVKVTAYDSELYTDADVQAAINVAKAYFKKEFSGCTLTEITYAGDEKIQGYAEWADRNNADEVIVLSSSFDVDGSGGDGSLNPNSTYENWNWILVRCKGGRWKHVDHGY